MTDVHIHIERGPYTKAWIDRFVDQALRAGLDAVCLLEHSHRFVEFAPMYESVCRYSSYQRDWYRSKAVLSIRDYQALITDMRREQFPLPIRWGLEVCYFPGYEPLVREILDSFDFDFAVGSVHWVNGFGFDHRAEFWEGIDVDALYRDYYDLMLRLAESGLFCGVAHPDSIKCFHHYPTADLTGTYARLADALNAHQMYAEQSGGLALNYGFPEPGMNPAMLRVFREKQVRIALASDAHRPEDVGANFPALLSRLRA